MRAQFIALMISSHDDGIVRWVGTRSKRQDLDQLMLDVAAKHSAEHVAAHPPGSAVDPEQVDFIVLSADTLSSHQGQLVRYDARSAGYVRPKAKRRRSP